MDTFEDANRRSNQALSQHRGSSGFQRDPEKAPLTEQQAIKNEWDRRLGRIRTITKNLTKEVLGCRDGDQAGKIVKSFMELIDDLGELDEMAKGHLGTRASGQ